MTEEKIVVQGFSGIISIPHDLQVDAAWFVDMYGPFHCCVMWPGSRLINNPLKWADDTWVRLSMQRVSKRDYWLLTENIDRALAELCAKSPEIPIICSKGQGCRMTRSGIVNFFIENMKGRRG